MTNSNPIKPASTTAGLTKTSPAASVELTEGELSVVTGGDAVTVTATNTVNKAKTADKAAAAMNGYIRG